MATRPDTYIQLRVDKSPVEGSTAVYLNLRICPWISWDDSGTSLTSFLGQLWYYDEAADRVYLGIRLCTKIV
jgi:hypothetical protein